jgi:hypothetical protein
MAEWTEMSAREWRSILPFSAKCVIRPNTFFGLMGFGQTGFRPNEFRPIEVGSFFLVLLLTIEFWSIKSFEKNPHYHILPRQKKEKSSSSSMTEAMEIPSSDQIEIDIHKHIENI